MILDEEVIKLAKTCGFDSFTGEKDDGTQTDYWECWEDQLIEFAQKIHEMGYNEGYDEGWDSRAQSEYTHSGMFGEPQ